MISRPFAIGATGALLLAACAETPNDRQAAAPAASASGADAYAAPPRAATSPTSPLTVNPVPTDEQGQPLPTTPPTLPREDPAADDDAMPPGPVNPGEP